MGPAGKPAGRDGLKGRLGQRGGRLRRVEGEGLVEGTLAQAGLGAGGGCTGGLGLDSSLGAVRSDI